MHVVSGSGGRPNGMGGGVLRRWSSSSKQVVARKSRMAKRNPRLARVRTGGIAPLPSPLLLREQPLTADPNSDQFGPNSQSINLLFLRREITGNGFHAVLLFFVFCLGFARTSLTTKTGHAFFCQQRADGALKRLRTLHFVQQLTIKRYSYGSKISNFG